MKFSFPENPQAILFMLLAIATDLISMVGSIIWLNIWTQYNVYYQTHGTGNSNLDRYVGALNFSYFIIYIYLFLFSLVLFCTSIYRPGFCLVSFPFLWKFWGRFVIYLLYGALLYAVSPVDTFLEFAGVWCWIVAFFYLIMSGVGVYFWGPSAIELHPLMATREQSSTSQQQQNNNTSTGESGGTSQRYQQQQRGVPLPTKQDFEEL